jgi:peptidoglycan/xylan/chitin deacetylase (PgdA/CDA1 family)
MYLTYILLPCAAFVLFLSGCGTNVSSQWRNDALRRFDTALSVGAEGVAPEETDNIRLTLSMADRYHRHGQFEDADRLYQLSSQKSQLLYRNMVHSTDSRDSTMRPTTERILLSGEFSDDSAWFNPEKSDQDLPVAEQVEGPETGKSYQSRDLSFSPAKKRPSSTRPVRSNVSPSTQSFRRASPAETTLYLTFDDGPSHLTMPIATYLKSEGVLATFFALGSNIKGREKIVSNTIAMGHRVGNHTLSHNLQKLRVSFTSDSSEVLRTRAMLERLGGDGRMVRIPYGDSTKVIVSHVTTEGAQIFEWDLNSNDSTRRGIRDHVYIEQTVVRQLNRNMKKHVILLFHDGAGHDTTLTALRSLIPRLKQEGYRFGVLSRNEKVAHATERKRVD